MNDVGRWEWRGEEANKVITLQRAMTKKGVSFFREKNR